MKKNVIVALFAVAIGLFAQEQPKQNVEDPIVTHVIQLKYADAGRFSNLLRSYGQVSFDDQLKALTIRVHKSLLPEIEQLVRRLDVPPPAVQNVEVTIYLLSALAQPSAGAGPPGLESAVKQLKRMFS